MRPLRPPSFGLHVTASPPTAVHACRCGHYAEAVGAAAVQKLTTAAPEHRETCPLVEPAPCRHCGQPTRAFSQGLTGYPAHPECRATWEAKPAEQRRRRKAAEAIAVSQRTRYQRQLLRERLERDGVTPDVIAGIMAGGFTEEVDEDEDDD